MQLEIPSHTTETQLQLRNFVINFITVLLRFGTFKIHFMNIQLSFIILRKLFENSVHSSQNFKIPLLKNIVNSLNGNQSNFLPPESVPSLFTDSSVEKHLVSCLSQSNPTDNH